MRCIKSIAYTASYNNNQDVYVMPVGGGIPIRLTYQSHDDRVLDWHPDGKHILFASGRESGIGKLRHFYKVSIKGGFPEKLKIPYGELASYSPDGKHIAFWSDRSGEFEVWLVSSHAKGEARQLTKRNKGFGYDLFWSPNSQKLAFINEQNDISVLDVESAKVTVAGNTNWNLGHNGRFGYPIKWSADSKWITFSLSMVCR
jgi:Tol biopolymer transport system component